MQNLLLWNKTAYAQTLSNFFGKENVLTSSEGLADNKELEKSSSLIVLCELDWNMKGEATNRQQLQGLRICVNFRLQNFSAQIFLLSFLSIELLREYDTFGILSLPGTSFIRLPFTRKDLIKAIGSGTDNETPIQSSDWESFAITASKSLLQEKIRTLKHGGKLAYGNQVINPLRTACISVAEYPECVSIVKENLQSLRHFTEHDDVSELFSLAHTARNFHDEYLQQVCSFASGLQQLKSYAYQEDVNIQKLISDIDDLNARFKTILNS